MGRTRLISHPAALGAGKRKHRWWQLRLHGRVEVVLLAVGRDPADRRARDRRQGPELRHRLRVRARASRRRSSSRRTRTACATVLAAPGPRRREDPARHRQGARQQRLPDLDRDAQARRSVTRHPDGARDRSTARREPDIDVDRPDLRQHGRQERDDRDHRVADGHQRLHRAAIRVEVRRAGADRVDARHPDHGGRLRAHRPGGDDVDGRGAADHPGLLALRHDHRVRPRARERAAHAARGVLADRQPLDERGPHPVAGDVVLHGCCRSSRCCCSAARR